MKKITLICILCFSAYIVKAQTPNEDPAHWQLVIYDNFSSFNDHLWGKVRNMTWGSESFSDNNTTISNNTLNLTCDINPNYNPNDPASKKYVSGGIGTIFCTRNPHPAFSYGYFEIETKMPPRSRGYWGGFWMHAGSGACDLFECCDTSLGGDAQDWHELDIFEPNGVAAETPNHFPSSVRETESPCCSRKANRDAYLNTFLDEGFNKIAATWMPKEAKIYVNDTEVVSLSDDYKYNYVPTVPMYLYLTFQIDPHVNCSPNETSIFPATWQYRNFKYYKLKTRCGEEIRQSNFDFVNHDYYVQKLYELTNSTVPDNTNIFLRAVDYILLNSDFEVPAGSGFDAITYGICPE